MSQKSYGNTRNNTLARTCNVTDNVHVNNAFLIEIIFILKAIKSYFKGSYDKQNLTLVVISYEIYKKKLAEGSFHEFHMK